MCSLKQNVVTFSVWENTSNIRQKMREGKQMPLEDFMLLLPSETNSTLKSIPIPAKTFKMCSDFYSENAMIFNSLLHGTEGLFLRDIFFQMRELFSGDP